MVNIVDINNDIPSIFNALAWSCFLNSCWTIDSVFLNLSEKLKTPVMANSAQKWNLACKKLIVVKNIGRKITILKIEGIFNKRIIAIVKIVNIKPR